MNRIHRMTLVACIVLAAAAMRGIAADENAPENLSPQLKASLQEIDANGKQISLELQKTLDAVKKLIVTVQPDQLNQEDVKQQLETALNPIRVSFEVTAVQTYLTILEKSITGQTDPKLPMGIELMAKYFSVPVEDVRSLYTEKQLPLSSIGLGLSIATVTGKPAKQIFARQNQSQSWVEIALENGVKPGQLQKIVEAFFQFAGAGGK